MTRARHRSQGRRWSEPPFPCVNSGRAVPGLAPGTNHRNHCPHCLSSIHLDIRVGDRRSGCRGVMAPIAVWAKEDGEWAIVHRCGRCGKVVTNRIAGDDDERALKELALRPIARRGEK